MTEPVIMEVLAGARDDRREHDLRRLMQRCPLMRFEAAIDFDAATRIYRRCRRSGVIPRGMVDCMIARAPGSRIGARDLLISHTPAGVPASTLRPSSHGRQK